MKLILHPVNEVSQSVPILKWHVPPVRTYEQIARILAERGETPIKPRTVGRICANAIAKVRRALMGDPQIRAGLLQPPLRLQGERWAKKA